MKIFSIYINNTDGYFIICAENERQAEQLMFSDEDSPLFKRDYEKDAIHTYEEKNLFTDHKEPTLISWMLNEQY
jgi:hypothetical protein